jgi:hypothetical protein
MAANHQTCHGLTNATPVFVKSATLRVTTVNLCSMAVYWGQIPINYRQSAGNWGQIPINPLISSTVEAVGYAPVNGFD